jgi:hypothetical protein
MPLRSVVVIAQKGGCAMTNVIGRPRRKPPRLLSRLRVINRPATGTPPGGGGGTGQEVAVTIFSPNYGSAPPTRRTRIIDSGSFFRDPLPSFFDGKSTLRSTSSRRIFSPLPVIIFAFFPRANTPRRGCVAHFYRCT